MEGPVMEEINFVGEKLAPYNPTNLDAIDIAIDLLEIHSGDKIYDLGCGDARFLVRACQRVSDVSGVGIEYDRNIFERAMEQVRSNAFEDKIQIIHDNVLNIDISSATVIFVYLVPEGIRKMKNTLLEALSRGVRIVTYVFSIPDITPKEVKVYKSSTKIYLYKQE
eukprot:gene10710-11668_t